MYQSGIRVYLLFFIMAVLGVLAGINLPVSLYPNSSKPAISINIGLTGLSPTAFYETYGMELESRLQSIDKGDIHLDQVIATYDNQGVNFEVFFEWGVSNDVAISEVEKVVTSFKAGLPNEMARTVSVGQWNRNSGFFALSFFSPTRSVSEIYEITNGIFMPLLATVKDAENPTIYNPNQKELTIVLNPMKMASYGILPRHIQAAISQNLQSYSGGVVKNGNKSLNIKLEINEDPIEKISKTIITRGDKNFYLSELAEIKYDISENQSRMFKTNGSSSLILFASPKGGGNVKQMSEDIITLVKNNKHRLPSDIGYRVLVDPSEFIRSSINNLFHEVAVAALLAVLILFLFIGDIKNVITSFIEIPLSMVVAFILMWVFDVNLNLISLGGLALAAGMNVDASVVVLDNIITKLKFLSKNGDITLSNHQKLLGITEAVKEVAAPVVVSMITTLVVFIPIALTSNLTNAVLGDLAKAVIYSHCFSAIVALVLVPTIRYQIVSKKQQLTFSKAPLRKFMLKVDDRYDIILKYLFMRKKFIYGLIVGMFSVLLLLSFLILPKLPKEIIGKPDSDWLLVWMKSSESSHIKETEQILAKIEDDVMTALGDYFRYTFVQVNNKKSGSVMFRLKDKEQTTETLKKLQAMLKNTPAIFYYVDAWNPASLPLPKEMDLKMKVTGPNMEQNLLETDKLISQIREKKYYTRIWSTPNSELEEVVQIKPYMQIWNEIRRSGVDLLLSDVIDYTRVAKNDKQIGQLVIEDRSINMRVSYGQDGIESLTDLRSMPFNINDKIIPLSALGDVLRTKEKPPIYRENGESMVLIAANLDKDDKRDYKDINKNIENLVQTQRESLQSQKINIQMLDPKVELSDALQQLAIALFISLILIFIALTMQFGNFISPLIVMLAIPLGLIGVLVSLFVFDSTLSLNSALGMILLNGIAVNNSILIVDFSNSIFNKGHGAYEAVLEAARKRLRPILITSLTTILGMFPIAIGMGEGGKILKPLGIAVSGGLWVSTLLTIIIIPSVQYLYLSYSEKNKTSNPLVINEKIHPILSGEQEQTQEQVTP